MIISFEVENFRSINDRQEVSFVASSLKDCEDGIIETSAFPNRRLLPALLFYGSNAAGKSNLVKAFNAMVKTVLFSQSRGLPQIRIPTREPFLLDKSAKDRPTVFEVNFIVDNIRFNYGFSVFDTAVDEEWLYSYPLGAPRKLFERKGMEFSFGRNLRGRNTTISELTRNNSLFLSAAAQNNHELLSDVFNFFDSIQIETSLDTSDIIAGARIKNEHNMVIDHDVIDFLGEIKTGITGYRTKDIEISEKSRELTRKLGLAVHSVMKEIDKTFQPPEENDVEKVIELEHQGQFGDKAYFALNLESAGTLRLLSALPKVLGVLKRGGIVVVDELDLSLHTQAAEKLLRLFCNKESNPKGAQIFATTHDTNLLESPCLRRDQVWFVSKDDTGATEIYPLTDIQTRPTDNIEKGYLQGRFGATPF